MTGPILVTGSEGLIGRALRQRLRALGHTVRGFDRRARGTEHGDLLDARALDAAVAGARGVVHLAAMSRVLEGEANPDLCDATNHGATRRIAERAPDTGARWMLFGSSREVYGDLRSGLIAEDTPARPMNSYGRAKARAEDAVVEASRSGFHGSVVRFSSVFGGSNDHATRVVPLFLAQAAKGTTLAVEGASHTFDFTFLDEVVTALCRLVERLDEGAAPPPIHLATGRGTTLWDLASAASKVTGAGAPLIETAPRNCDMGYFVGDPARAAALLGWRHAPGSIEAFLTRAFARQDQAARGLAPARA